MDKGVEGMWFTSLQVRRFVPSQEWDVLTRIGGTPIDNQGMVKLDKDLRVSSPI